MDLPINIRAIRAGNVEYLDGSYGTEITVTIEDDCILAKLVDGGIGINKLSTDVVNKLTTLVDKSLDKNSGNAIQNSVVAGKFEEVSTTINNISNGSTVVGKAKSDSNGNIITDTYATKSQLGQQVNYSFEGNTLTITTK